MLRPLLVAWSCFSLGDAHGFLSNPLPRSIIPMDAGPKTSGAVQARTWSSCNSSVQADMGKGSRGYASYTAGRTTNITWNITLPHDSDDLQSTGVSFYWRDNTNASDTFQAHDLLGLKIRSGGYGVHKASVPMPTRILSDATLLWLWTSTDGGYYFGCADFKTVAGTAAPTIAGNTGAPTTAGSTLAPTYAPTPQDATITPTPLNQTVADDSASSTVVSSFMITAFVVSVHALL